jgi:hypothetical protein
MLFQDADHVLRVDRLIVAPANAGLIKRVETRMVVSIEFGGSPESDWGILP